MHSLVLTPDVSSQTIIYDGSADNKLRIGSTARSMVCLELMLVQTAVCTVTADGEGAVNEVIGVWTFIPAYLGPDGESTDGADLDLVATREDDLTEPSVAVIDVDYLWFGWWTEVKDGDVVGFQTFFDGEKAVIDYYPPEPAKNGDL